VTTGLLCIRQPEMKLSIGTKMPIYEYECAVCGQRFEQLQGPKAAKPLCPSGHKTVRRCFCPPGIIFRGDGFYCTDNRTVHSSERKNT